MRSTGELTSKKGFSVVAPIRISVPSSTPGSNASCWFLAKRWISSRKSTVRRSSVSRRWRARARTSRMSLTPAEVAERVSKGRVGVVGNQAGQGGLARPRRAPEDHRDRPVSVRPAGEMPPRDRADVPARRPRRESGAGSGWRAGRCREGSSSALAENRSDMAQTVDLSSSIQ